MLFGLLLLEVLAQRVSRLTERPMNCTYASSPSYIEDGRIIANTLRAEDDIDTAAAAAERAFLISLMARALVARLPQHQCNLMITLQQPCSETWAHLMRPGQHNQFCWTRCTCMLMAEAEASTVKPGPVAWQ